MNVNLNALICIIMNVSSMEGEILFQKSLAVRKLQGFCLIRVFLNLPSGFVTILIIQFIIYLKIPLFF